MGQGLAGLGYVGQVKEPKGYQMLKSVVEHLRKVDSFNKHQLRREFDHLKKMSDAEWGIFFTNVLDSLNKENRVFQPDGKGKANYKLANSHGARNRAEGFIEASRRKHSRAIDIMTASVVLAEDPNQKLRQERALLRLANKQIDNSIEISKLSKSRPKGL